MASGGVLSQRRTSIWGGGSGAEDVVLNEVGPMHEAVYKEHVEARRNTKEADISKPYSGKNIPKAELYGCLQHEASEKWFGELAAEDESPTEEQLALLRAVASRVRREASEEQADRNRVTDSEPMFDMIHGVQGID